MWITSSPARCTQNFKISFVWPKELNFIAAASSLLLPLCKGLHLRAQHLHGGRRTTAEEWGYRFRRLWRDIPAVLLLDRNARDGLAFLIREVVELGIDLQRAEASCGIIIRQRVGSRLVPFGTLCFVTAVPYMACSTGRTSSMCAADGFCSTSGGASGIGSYMVHSRFRRPRICRSCFCCLPRQVNMPQAFPRAGS